MRPGERDGQPAQDLPEDRAGMPGGEGVGGKEENEPSPQDGRPPGEEPSRNDGIACHARSR